MATPSSISVKEIPLFPLPEVVLFPSGNLPLHIFEERYKLMMADLLRGDRCFGVLRWDPQSLTASKVGCAAEIGKVVLLQDGRMNMMTKGSRRFHLLDYVKEKPYLVGLVEWFDDDHPDRDLSGLKEDALRLLSDVVRLSAKLTEKHIELPNDLPDDAQQLSFWIAGNLYGDAGEQQSLLELQETSVRLEREIESLNFSCKELAARTAIKDAMS